MPGVALRTTLDIRRTAAAGRPRLELRGELDCATASLLRTRINDALAEGTSCLALDLAGLSFIDAAGLGVLIWAARQLRERDGHLHLHRVPRGVQRVFGVTGVAALLVVDAIDEGCAAATSGDPR